MSGLFGSSISGGLGSSMSGAVGAQNSMSFNQQAAQQYNAAQNLSFSQQAAQQYNAILAQKAQIQRHAQIANLGKHYNANRQTYEWVWNGRPVSITEFAELAYGDTSQKTMFLLKHSDKKEN